jgi:hypothetical protein
MKTTKVLFGILTITTALAVQVQAQYPFTNGLVAYYPFNGNANDASGNGNNGTAQNATFRLVSNRLAATFTGALNSSVQVPDSPSLEGITNAVTLSLWFDCFADTEWVGCLVDKAWKQPVSMDWSYRAWSSWWQGGSCDCVSLSWTPNYASSQDPNVLGANGLNHNQWYHVVFTVNGGNGTSQIYTNGILAESFTETPFSLSTGSFPLVIGAPVAQTASNQTGFNGAINDVRIYNRALSASEVQQLYAYESGPSIALLKAVKPSFSKLTLGVKYQLQASLDLNTWYDQGLPFSATSTNMVYSQYWDVDDWNQLFFRLQVAP